MRAPEDSRIGHRVFGSADRRLAFRFRSVSYVGSRSSRVAA